MLTTKQFTSNNARLAESNQHLLQKFHILYSIFKAITIFEKLVPKYKINRVYICFVKHLACL